MSASKERQTTPFTPPAQAELKPTPILEDEAPASVTSKKRVNRQSLKAAYLTDTTPVQGSGVNLQ